MATSSVLNCAYESWEISHFYQFWSSYNNLPMIQIVRDGDNASNLVHYFTIRNDATTVRYSVLANNEKFSDSKFLSLWLSFQVNLKAILSLDRPSSPSKSSFVLSIVRNGYHSNTRVYVRLHDIKIFVDSREVIGMHSMEALDIKLISCDLTLKVKTSHLKKVKCLCLFQPKTKDQVLLGDYLVQGRILEKSNLADRMSVEWTPTLRCLILEVAAMVVPWGSSSHSAIK